MPAKTPIYLKSTNSKKGKKCRLRDILSPDMISPPLGDFRHTIHIGKGGERDTFGDMSFLQGKFELLPGKGEAARPQCGAHSEFLRANSASDASFAETPSPVLKNAISLPTIGGSQALTLPLISTTVFPAAQDPLGGLAGVRPTPPGGSEEADELEILQMDALFRSITVFGRDPSPPPKEIVGKPPLVINLVETPDKPLAKKKLPKNVKKHNGENGFQKPFSYFITGNGNGNCNGNENCNGYSHCNGNMTLLYEKELSDIHADWVDRDSGVEDSRICDFDFELFKGQSLSQDSLSQITGSLLSLELDLGPSILDDVLNIMDRP